MPGSRRELWPQALTFLDGVDCILHAGDLHTASVIDLLSEIAPTYVARGNGDVGVHHDQLRDTWLLEFEDVKIAMVHEFPTPSRRTDEVVLDRIERLFPSYSPDVLVYGHTHMEEIHRVRDVLCVNPGSPLLPRNQSTRFGTVGFLDIDGGDVRASLVQLTEDGGDHLPSDHRAG